MHDDARQRLRQPRKNLPILRVQPIPALSRINQHEREIRALDRIPCSLDAQALDRVAGLAQSGSVDHGERDAADLDAALERVARGARHLGHDRDVVAREAVELILKAQGKWAQFVEKYSE